MQFKTHKTPRLKIYINYCVEDDHETYAKDVLPTKFNTQAEYNRFLAQIETMDVLPCMIEDIYAEGKRKGLFAAEDNQDLMDDEFTILGWTREKGVTNTFSALEKSKRFAEGAMKSAFTGDVKIVVGRKDGGTTTLNFKTDGSYFTDFGALYDNVNRSGHYIFF